MNKSIFLLGVALLLGAGFVASLRPLPLTKCPAVEFEESRKGCETSESGEFHCSFGFLQPERWGFCAHKKSGGFGCLKNGRVSFYGENGATADSWIAQKTCPALTEQIKKNGQPPTMLVPVEITPESPKQPRT